MKPSPKKAVPQNANNQQANANNASDFFSPGKFFQPDASLTANKTKSGPQAYGTVYTTKGKKIGDTTENGTDVIIVYDKQQARALKKQAKAAEKAGEIFKVDMSTLGAQDYFVLPPLAHRKEIESIMKNDTTKGHTEYGGRGLIPVNMDTGELEYDKSAHVRAKDGDPAGPEDTAAQIKLSTIHESETTEVLDEKIPSRQYAVDYTWHSHPGGEWNRESGSDKWLSPDEYRKQQRKKEGVGSGTTIGGPGVETKGYDLGPSTQDISVAKSQYERSKKEPVSGTEDQYHLLEKNFVIHKKQNKVFFYNQNTPLVKGAHNAKMKLNLFFTLQ